ncbi:MAG: GDP-mannose 4,6-dehydratase [Candidatus Lokiarchaeota archaeon]|nr:GDP-mannose 4,6-dehydratase [Candidatus Lokiarchaeota archaeon]
MEKILITGVNGFIGSHLTDFCMTKNIALYGIDRPNQEYRDLSHYTNNKLNFIDDDKLEFHGELIKIPTANKRFTLLECDIKNATLLEKIIRKVEPDILFHFAAQPYILRSWEEPIETIKTNIIGTINIFESIKKFKLKTRVVTACTSAEYGTSVQLNRPLKEDDPLLAIHPYGISKIATELLARQYYINFGIEIINLRFFNQTGIRRTNDAPSDFIRKVAKIELGQSEPIIQVGNLNPYRDFTDIKDSKEAIWLAALKGKPGETYNVCSNKKIQIRRLLDIILSFSKEKIQVIKNTPQKVRKTDEDIVIGDNTKIKEDLGWVPITPIETTLKEMYKYWLKYFEKRT